VYDISHTGHKYTRKNEKHYRRFISSTSLQRHKGMIHERKSHTCHRSRTDASSEITEDQQGTRYSRYWWSTKWDFRIPGFLLNIYNRCITEASFPTMWKMIKLVLLSKTNPPDVPSSYRPLCMLNTVGKLFEKILDIRKRPPENKQLYSP